jgi:hypothetical protein
MRHHSTGWCGPPWLAPTISGTPLPLRSAATISCEQRVERSCLRIDYLVNEGDLPDRIARLRRTDPEEEDDQKQTSSHRSKLRSHRREGYYALAEQVAGDIIPDVLTLQQSRDDSVFDGFREEFNGGMGAAVLTVNDSPPRVSVTATTHEAITVALRRRQIVIRHATGDRIVALIDPLLPTHRSASYAGRLCRARARPCHRLRRTTQREDRTAGYAVIPRA